MNKVPETVHQSCESSFLSLVPEWAAVFLWYLSCYLVGVKKGDEDLELKQKHYLIGQLRKNQQIITEFTVGKQSIII